MRKILTLCESRGEESRNKVAREGFIVKYLEPKHNHSIKEGKISASEEYLKYLIKKGIKI